MKLITQKELLSRAFQGRSFADSFWKRIQVDGPDACWTWKGAKAQRGYGRVRVKYQLWISSRMAWTLTNGDIPKGKQVLHRCDNPPCCNPGHLFLGTDFDNRHDAIAKKRWNPFHLCSLKIDQVDKIRRDYKVGDVTQVELGEHYGVRPSVIGAIVRNRTYIKDWGTPQTK